MSLWKEYLAKKLVFDNHPALNSELCMNRMQTRNPCTSCMDVCPEHVFAEPCSPDAEPDWTACIGCGLCVSACPSRAIAPARLYAEKFLLTASHLLNSITHDITITCKKEASSADIYAECPGSVPWELLCFFTLQGRVVFLVDDCETCANASCKRMLDDSIARVHSFWNGDDRSCYDRSCYDRSSDHCNGDHRSGEDTTGAGPEERVIVASDPSLIPPRRYTRREAISFAMKKTGRTAAVLLPDPEKTVPDGMLFKKLLLHRIRQMRDTEGEKSPQTAFFWQLPSFTERCSACGICTRICPVGAILRAPGPENSGRFYMALLPEKCTGCGLCSGICPESGIKAPAAVRVEDPSRPILHAVAAVPCPRCKEPVPAGSGSALCPRCRGELGIHI